eukprot:358238-Rhodomonas_salina.3
MSFLLALLISTELLIFGARIVTRIEMHGEDFYMHSTLSRFKATSGTTEAFSLSLTALTQMPVMLKSMLAQEIASSYLYAVPCVALCADQTLLQCLHLCFAQTRGQCEDA